MQKWKKNIFAWWHIKKSLLNDAWKKEILSVIKLPLSHDYQMVDPSMIKVSTPEKPMVDPSMTNVSTRGKKQWLVPKWQILIPRKNQWLIAQWQMLVPLRNQWLVPQWQMIVPLAKPPKHLWRRPGWMEEVRIELASQLPGSLKTDGPTHPIIISSPPSIPGCIYI